MKDSSKPSALIFSPKPIFVTLGIYAILAALIYWADRVSPGGPCTPGMGILLLLLVPIISAILLVVTLVLVLRGRRTQIVPAILHGLVIIAFVILWLCTRM
jgi:hypothetical protein